MLIFRKTLVLSAVFAVGVLLVALLALAPQPLSGDGDISAVVLDDDLTPLDLALPEKDEQAADVSLALSLAALSWSNNVRVDTGISPTVQNAPDIAMDLNGNAYAVWQDGRNGNADTYFSYRPAGGGWGVNVKVNDDPSTSGQYSPAIDVDTAGNAYAVWLDDRNGNTDIYFSYRPAGGSWQANIKVSDDPSTASQLEADIAVDTAGNAYVVWRDIRNGNADIYFSFRPAGGSWQTNAKVNDDPGTAGQIAPAVAVDTAGNAYILWTDGRNSNDDIYSSYRPAGGSWQANLKVNGDPGTASQIAPAVAVDTAGNAYAAWQDHRNGLSDIYFSYRPVGASWQANVKVSDDPATSNQYSPAIAVDPAGNAYAVWQDIRNGNFDIYFSYRPTGGNWQPNTKINKDSGTAMQWGSAIAVDAVGNAYALWEDSRNANYDIYGSFLPAYLQRINAGGPAYTGGGKTWEADNGFVGGAVVTFTAAIANTTDDPLYQAERNWPVSAIPGYKLLLPNGQYWVTLKFSENVCTVANCRTFDIEIENVLVLQNYDIFAAAGGKNIAAPDRNFLVYVTDGLLNINFVKVLGKPKVNAIQVRRVFAQRLNAGGPRYSVGSWLQWQPDRAFTPGAWGYLGSRTATFTTANPIAGTNDAPLYQTERNGMLSYTFVVPNGQYAVTLKFSENQVNAAGQRIFDVRLQNTLVLSNFDVWVAAGNSRFKAVDRTFNVTVTDRLLTIDFWPKVGAAKINAIQIVGR